jgi:hypothetical protein
VSAPDDDWAPVNVDPTAGDGHPRIDETLGALAAARDAPPADQVAPLTEAHRTLRETLDSIGDV